MSTPVKDGDEITVANTVLGAVLHHGPLFHAVVVGPTFRRRLSVTFQWRVGGNSGWTADDEEGVVWIRGHQAETSVEATALLAAHALR